MTLEAAMRPFLLALALILFGQSALADEAALWVLSTVDGAAVDYTATLDLSQQGRLTGQAPCNRYFADAVVEGETLTLGPIGATRMACLQIKGEADYFATLSLMDSLTQTDETLTLRGGGHEMAFIPQKD